MANDTQTATATETDEAKKPSPKKILLSVVNKFVETNVDLVPLLGADIAATVADWFEGLKTTQVRGLPAADRLANVEALILAHYKSMPKLDSAEHGAWAYESMKLLQRKARIEREIADGGAHVVKGTKGAKAANGKK